MQQQPHAYLNFRRGGGQLNLLVVRVNVHRQMPAAAADVLVQNAVSPPNGERVHAVFFEAKVLQRFARFLLGDAHGVLCSSACCHQKLAACTLLANLADRVGLGVARFERKLAVFAGGAVCAESVVPWVADLLGELRFAAYCMRSTVGGRFVGARFAIFQRRVLAVRARGASSAARIPGERAIRSLKLPWAADLALWAEPAEAAWRERAVLASSAGRLRGFGARRFDVVAWVAMQLVCCSTRRQWSVF